MIGVLGFQRVVIILVLLGVNIVLGAAIYLYMEPETTKQERQLRSLRSQSNQVQDDISRMQIEYDQFEAQRAQFELYKQDGFFVLQNRRQIERFFKKIQEKSGVSIAKVAVNPANVEGNKDAEKADHRILKSVIQIKIEALDDKDVFHYLHLIEQSFPGHVTVEKLGFSRAGEINGTVLRAIAGGKNFPLVSADVELEWRTMVPQGELINTEGER